MGQKLNFDVVVIGGGLAGICASIASARSGSRTALVHDRPVLGGNNSSEIRVGISGADCSGSSLTRYSRESGIINELATENLYRNPGASSSIMDIVCWDAVRRERNLSLFLNSHAEAAVMTGRNTIQEIAVIQTSTEKRLSFEGKIFIDCSGDGTIAASAGAKYRVGREARSEFDESLALDKADTNVMGSSLIFTTKDMGRPVSFAPPAWAHHFPTDKNLPFRPHRIGREGQAEFWWMAYGGTEDTIGNSGAIYEELLKILFGLWDHIKNKGDHGAENMALEWISPIPGKRESRRFIGDEILSQNDISRRRLFPDRIAYGGWPIDIHPPEGIFSSSPPTICIQLRELYGIPFSCLYSRNIKNLLFAGRNISVTHVGLGSTRVMGTCAVIGQAAGTAGHLCARYGLSPRELRKKKIAELQQQLLRDDCHIPGVRNEDPLDLARKAVVRASTEAKLQAENIRGFEPISTPVAQLFPVSRDRIECIELFLKSVLATDKEVGIALYPAESINDFSAEKSVAEATAVVRARRRSWTKFDLKVNTAPGKLWWIYVPAIKGISWGYQEEAPLGTNRAAYVKDSGWRSRRGSYAYRFRPDSYPYAPVNVVNGVTRPEAWPNLWISNPAKPLPQSLEIIFERPRRISSIHLTFDGGLDTNIYLPPPYGILGTTRVIRECVRDYALYYNDGKSWKRIVRVTRNYHRCRAHYFTSVLAKKVRLKVQATNGIAEARVFEVRVYGGRSMTLAPK
ncbi:FAD-dependent oxidoreductase [Verrucomicrobiota bacterium]